MVQKILKNSAVFGMYRPCYSLFVDGRMRRVPDPEGPIENYYPPIVSKELFEAAQRARASRTTARPGRRLLPKRTNLFSGLGHCVICGSSLYLSLSANGYNYLKCVKGYDWACSNRFGFPYRKLEAVFLALDDLMLLVRELLNQRSVDDFPCSDLQQERVFSRFRTARALMESPQLPDAMEARHRLLSEVRRLCEGVVLHANRLITLHVNSGLARHRVVLILTPSGLQGIQIRRDTGEIGFITAAVTEGFVRPTGSGISKMDADKPAWHPATVKNILEHVQIVVSPAGDWEAIVSNPGKMIDAVTRAEHILLGSDALSHSEM
jgi:hypothetical protein